MVGGGGRDGDYGEFSVDQDCSKTQASPLIKRLQICAAASYTHCGTAFLPGQMRHHRGRCIIIQQPTESHSRQPASWQEEGAASDAKCHCGRCANVSAAEAAHWWVRASQLRQQCSGDPPTDSHSRQPAAWQGEGAAIDAK